MHTEIKIKDGFYYVGGSERRLALFENVYPLTNGVSYNSYLYLDEKSCLLDTVDSSISTSFFENLEYLLGERQLDYLIINHMEPDHAANIANLLLRYPDVKVYMSVMAKRFLFNYFPSLKADVITVKEGDELNIGSHTFTFIMAPFVHWPEVMMSYEKSEKVLFSADAFGTFGALNGDLYSSKWNFDINEARRYYAGIVGKYGDNVKAVLAKAAKLDIDLLCPLHGPIHTKEGLPSLLNYYTTWASFEPEEKAVMICYASSYGNSESCAMALANKVASKGVRNLVVYDVSKTDSSYLLSEAWRVKTIALVSTTYNAGIFPKMEDFLHELAAHSLKKRNFAIIENGSWGPMAKKEIIKILEPLKDIKILEPSITINSSLKEEQLPSIDALAEEIAKSLD